MNNKSIAKPEAFGLTPDASGLSAPILVKSQSTFDLPLSRAKRKKKRAQSDRGLPPDDELRKLADGGVASCVNAKTGELHWIERLTGSYSASPIYVNERVLFLSETGLATWVQAGRQFAKSGEN